MANWYGMNWITRKRRLAIYIADQFRCFWCNRDLRERQPGEITLDHLITRAAGGSNKSENLVTACRPCNSGRGDATLADWHRQLYTRRNAGRRPHRDIVEKAVERTLDYARERVLNLELAEALIGMYEREEANAE